MIKFSQLADWAAQTANDTNEKLLKKKLLIALYLSANKTKFGIEAKQNKIYNLYWRQQHFL